MASSAPNAGDGNESKKFLTRAEVSEHNKEDDQWLIIDDQVYDISKFAKRHPGGKVISFYKGEDATEPLKAFHPNIKKVSLIMKSLRVGTLAPQEMDKVPPVVKDFRKLRSDLENEGFFHDKYKLFYIFAITHVILLEVLGWYIIANWGQHSWALWATAFILATSQAQAGWVQHDFGHLSVFFRNRKLNLFLHHFTIGVLKGASSSWWNARHNRHHAKTNIFYFDPDVRVDPVFVFGEDLIKKGMGHRFLPYQQYYWWLFGPPTVTTLLFVFQNIRYVIVYGQWIDLVCMLSYFFRFGYVYGQYLSFWNCVVLYLGLRFIESHWFTWVTSMSHLPRKIRLPVKDENWFSLHLISTQNITSGPFHDWFTGHLNYQIEHHLFPSMPRWRYSKVAPRVEALAKKHNLPYTTHSVYQCCMDILHKLDEVGKLWEKQRSAKSS